MKKIIPIVCALLFIGISGINAEAADLPFVPDGEESISQTETSILTDSISSEVNDSQVQSNIEEKLPVEAVDESTPDIIDEEMTIADDKTVTVNDQNHLTISDKNGNESVLDDSQKYILTVNENGQTVISDEKGNFVSVNNGTVGYTDKDGKHITKDADDIIITENAPDSEVDNKTNSVWKYICIGMAAFIIIGSAVIFMIKRKKRG